MEKKKYASYKEIENELELLQLEREINYQKLVLSIEKTKEHLQPINLISGAMGFKSATNSKWYSTLLSAAIPLVLESVIPIVMRWITKKKRGD